VAYEFYNAWRTVAPTSPKQKYREDLQALVDEQFDNASDLLTIQSRNRTTFAFTDITVRVTKALQTSNTGLKYTEDDYKSILFQNANQDVRLGDVFVFSGYSWIVMNTDNINSPTASCEVRRCNYTLKLYESGILYQIPAINLTNITLTSTGIEENKFIVVNDDEMLLAVSNNNVTQNIVENDVFKIGRRNYKCISIQDVIMPGLLILKMKVTTESAPSIPDEQATYVINGVDNIPVGMTEVYTAIKYVGGEIDETAEFVFSVVDTGVPISAYTLTTIDTQNISIECKQYVYSLKIRATDASDETKYVEKTIVLANIF
jgi:hypothetical protein